MAPSKIKNHPEYGITDADMNKIHSAIANLPHSIESGETVGNFRQTHVRLSVEELRQMNARYKRMLSKIHSTLSSPQFFPENVANDSRFGRVLKEISRITAEISDTLRSHGFNITGFSFSERDFQTEVKMFETMKTFITRDKLVEEIDRQIKFLLEKIGGLKDYFENMILDDPREYSPDFYAVETLALIKPKIQKMGRKISYLKSKRKKTFLAFSL